MLIVVLKQFEIIAKAIINMKKIYYFLFFLLTFSFIKVNANELYCEYKVEETFGTAQLFISYSSSTNKVEVKKNATTINPNAGISLDFPENLSDTKLRDSNNNALMCPNLYYTIEYRSGGRSAAAIYHITFPDEAKSNSKKLDLVVSKVDNDENSGIEYDKKVSATCSYNYQNNKVLGLQIYTDETMGGYTLYGDYKNNDPKGFVDEHSECPTNLYMACGNGVCAIYSNPVGNAMKLVLTGAETDANGKDTSKIATYISISGNKTIYIKKGSSDSEIRAYYGNSYIKITDSNYKTIFSNKETSKFPINLTKNNDSISFSDELEKSEGTSANLSEVYILSTKRSILLGLNLDEIDSTCNALFGGGEGGFMTFLKDNVFKIIYIVVPIILLVLTTIDFSKVVFNDDKDGIKNAWKRFGKRAIAAVLIYLTPTILIFIADVIGADDVNSCIKAIQNMDK